MNIFDHDSSLCENMNKCRQKSFFKADFSTAASVIRVKINANNYLLNAEKSIIRDRQPTKNTTALYCSLQS
jgi:hypothetical protein